MTEDPLKAHGDIGRLIILGDLNGNLRTMLAQLYALDVLTPKDRTSILSETTKSHPPHLIFAGDIVADRVPQGLPCLALIAKIRAGLAAVGGTVTVLAGNHDLMAIEALGTDLTEPTKTFAKDFLANPVRSKAFLGLAEFLHFAETGRFYRGTAEEASNLLLNRGEEFWTGRARGKLQNNISANWVLSELASMQLFANLNNIRISHTFPTPTMLTLSENAEAANRQFQAGVRGLLYDNTHFDKKMLDLCLTLDARNRGSNCTEALTKALATKPPLWTHWVHGHDVPPVTCRFPHAVPFTTSDSNVNVAVLSVDQAIGHPKEDVRWGNIQKRPNPPDRSSIMSAVVFTRENTKSPWTLIVNPVVNTDWRDRFQLTPPQPQVNF